jgi:PAS domain S-box-containing protein
MIAPLPINEKERLKTLHEYEIVDTAPEQSFDDITLLASQICDTPMASITLVDENRQWFKSKVGITANETSRNIAFCAHTILQKDLFIVEDAMADERFASNPLVTGKPDIRFYAGAPLITSDGHALGTLCVIDQKPRQLTPLQKSSLEALSREVGAQLELRHLLKSKARGEDQLRASELSYRRLFEAAKDGILILDVKTGRITDVNPFLVELLCFSRNEMIGKTVGELSPFKDIESNKIMLERLQQHGYVRYEDLPLETRDGRHIAVEFVCNVYPAGSENVIQCNVRDITARKNSDEQLTLLNTCIANLNDIVLVTEAKPIDEPGPKIVFVNTAFERITGFTPAEAIGKTPRILQGAKTDRRSLEEIHQALASGKAINRQLINYRKDGTEYWMDIHITPVLNSAGKCTHFIAIERDITESKTLKESLKLFRALMERSPDAIEVVDPRTGRFLDVNETACRRLGYSREEMLLLGIQDVADLGNIPFSLHDNMAEARKTGSRTIETRHRRKDGSTFPVEINTRYVQMDQDYLLAVVRDITDRHRLEQTLRESEAKFRTLFDVANDANMVLFDGVFVDCNARTLEILGVTREKLIGQSPSAFSPFVQPDGRDSQDKAMGFIKKALTGEPQFFEWVNQRPDGLVVHMDVSLNRFELSGEVYIQAIGRDITARKLAEEQIAEQATFLDKAQDAIFVRDLNGKMLFWNKGAERMYGWTRQEVLGRNVDCDLYMHPDRLEQAYQQALGRGDWHGELEHFAKDGSELSIESRWTLIRDNEGNPKSILAINTDITEKKKIEIQFMRAQRMESIGTLAGGIAHDLNNILSPIMMAIDILKQGATDPQSIDILETIEISARRGADIVKQVLSFARGIEGQRIEVQPMQLLKDVESIIKDTFPKDIRLHFSIADDVWMILGDPTQVHQVLLNLCVNARDAMPNGGSLNLRAENCVLDELGVAMNSQAKVGRYVQISVADSGTGIPAGLLDKIFDPFFTTKDINKGTGLGLSTVMAIVKSHDGIINVLSEAGKGTAFKVYLPAMETSAQARKEQAVQANLPRGNGETILVVDDETSILTITSQTLKAFGYRVLTAGDGAEAVAQYAQHRHEIAVVITDMMMPIMGGTAAIHALKKIDPAVKIIVASGLNADGSADKSFETMVKHFLTKPYTAGTLLKVLRTILDEA